MNRTIKTTFICTAILLVGCSKHPSEADNGQDAPTQAAPPAESWMYANEPDKLTGKPVQLARLQETFDGGFAQLEAKCDFGQRLDLVSGDAAYNVYQLSYDISLFKEKSSPFPLDKTVTFGKDVIDVRASEGTSETMVHVTIPYSNNLIYKSEIGFSYDKDSKSAFTTGMDGRHDLKAIPTPLDLISVTKIEVPLEGGQKQVIDLHTDDPDFRKLLSECQAKGAETYTPKVKNAEDDDQASA